MRELVRTNDAVLISAIEALLNGADIGSYGGRPEYERAGRLDRHFPAPHPGRRRSNPGSAAACCRTPASATSYGLTLIETSTEISAEHGGTSEDAVLGGRLVLRQPLRGHRFGHDAILLAAAVPAQPGEEAVEFGAGVGAAGLALARRIDGLGLTLVEIDPVLTALAQGNAARNGLAPRARAVCLDVAASAAAFVAVGLAPELADHVLMNLPFNAPQNPSPIVAVAWRGPRRMRR